MAASICVRIESMKSNRASGQKSHDLRTGKVPAYVDKSRSHLNTNPILLEQPLLKTTNENTARKSRKDGVVGFAGIITFSHDAQSLVNELSTSQQDELFLRVAKTTATHFGSRVESLSIHRDENALHAHFSFANVNFETKKRIRPNAGDLKKLQDVAAQAAQKILPEIVRGKSKIQRIRDGENRSATIHRSVKELHNDLPIEIAALQSRILSTQEKLQKNEQRLLSSQKKLEKMMDDENASSKNIKKMKKRVSDYGVRVKNERESLEEISIEKRKLEQQIPALHQQKNELEQALSSLSPRQTKKVKIIKKHTPKRLGHDELVTITQEVVSKERYAMNCKKLKQMQHEHLELLKIICETNSYSMNIGKDEWQNMRVYKSYSCEVLDFGRLLIVRDGTDAQKASALYSQSKEKGWQKPFFSCAPEVAKSIIKFARADGKLECVDFENEACKRLLHDEIVQERADKKRELEEKREREEYEYQRKKFPALHQHQHPAEAKQPEPEAEAEAEEAFQLNMK